MNFEIKTKKFEDINVMYIFQSLSMENIEEMGKAFEKAAAYVMQHGGEISGSFTLYGECTEEIMNMDCCIAVKKLLPESGEIKAKTVPGGEFTAACTVHKGSYSELGKTWEGLMEWISKEGYSFDNKPMREIYINMPMQVPENELLTEIIIPIKK